MNHALVAGLAVSGAALLAATPASAVERYRLSLAQPDGPLEAAEPLERWPVSEDSFIRLRAAGWFTDTDGEADSDAPEGSDGNLEFEDDLGMDTESTVLWLTVGLNFFTEWHLNFSYTGPFELDGEATGVDVTFGDQRFAGDIESEFSLDLYDIELLYDLSEPEPVTVSLGVGIRVFDAELRVSGTAADDEGAPTGTTVSTTEDVTIPLPVIAAQVRWDISRNFFVRAFGNGMYAGDYGATWDIAGEVGFDFNRNVGLFGGYRFLHAEADWSGGGDDDGGSFDVDIHGPYAGVEVRF